MVQLSGNAFLRGLPYILNVADWYLQQWMETLGMNQADLSRETGYPKAKVSDLYNGKQRYNRVIINDVARALKIHPFELLMHPDDAMTQRRFRKAAEDMVKLPVSGVAGEAPEETPARKRA